MRLLLCTLAAALALLLLALLDFHQRMRSNHGDELPHQGVVFTGQFDRIRVALELMQRGELERLFISGVNPGAGLRKASFAQEFRLNDDLAQALAAGRIVLGPQATTTLQNAVETGCWWRGEPRSGQLLLVTSATHMPRASIALSEALPDVTILRRSLQENAAPGRLASEFGKYLATRLILLLPVGPRAWVGEMPACPDGAG